MEIYLVRHAASVRKASGIWGRLFDAKLDPDCLYQLDKAKVTLSSLQPRAVFSSPLLRCVQSARIIFGPDEPISVVKELRAYHSGILEELDEASVARLHPTYIGRTFKDKFTNPQFGEESIDAQAQRVREGFRYILQTTPETTTVIVSHYSVMNIICGLAAFEFDPRGYADGKIDVVEGGLVTLTVDRAALLRAIDALDDDASGGDQHE